MHPIIQKTFGGLSKAYYFRQFIFGIILSVIIYFLMTKGNRHIEFTMFFLLIINAILYPYSRFIYETVIGFIMGNNTFIVNSILFFLIKFLTMLLCWLFAIFIAPVGLAYLYFYHSRANNI